MELNTEGMLQVYRVADLLKKRQQILEKREKTNKDIILIDSMHDRNLYKQFYIELRKKEGLLYKELTSIEEELLFIMEPKKSDGVIDLRKIDNDIEGKYIICLHSTSQKIGEVEYGICKYYNDEKPIGNMVDIIESAELLENGYDFNALNLMGELLFENEIPNFFIESNKLNLDTILRYGGRPLENNLFGETLLIYECETRKRKIDEHSPINK